MGLEVKTMAAPIQGRNILLDDRGQQQAEELLNAVGGDVHSVAITDSEHRMVTVPRGLSAVIHEVLSAVADGARISINLLPDELTTTVAADQLGVSRPALMKMIQRGELDAHKVGSHHRVLATDVLALKQRRRDRQQEAMTKLRELDETLDQY